MLKQFLCGLGIFCGVAAMASSLNFKTAQERLPLSGGDVRGGAIGKQVFLIQGQKLMMRDAKEQWVSRELEFRPRLTVSGSDQAFLVGDKKVYSVSKTGLVAPVAVLPSAFVPETGTFFENRLWLWGKKLYSIDLKQSKSQWIPLESPIPAELKNPTLSGRFGELLCFGGELHGKPVSTVWGWREKPVDGTTRTGWRELKSLPFPLSGAGAWTTGQSHVALIGGKRSDGGASDKVLIFHLPTESYVEDETLPELITRPVVAEGEIANPDTGAIVHSTFNRVVRVLGLWDYLMITIYFAGIALMGLYFARKQNSSEEFMVGSRNGKWWATAISMFATGASSISFMAIPALAFHSNLVWMLPVFFGIPLYFISAYWVYPMIIKLRLTSIYEYLDQRFHPSIRYIASLQCIIFEVFGRMSIVLLLPSLAISAVTGLSVPLSILLMGILTTAYTMLGGFDAVIWTDVAQGVMMLLGALIMIVLAVTGLTGGLGDFVSIGQMFHKFDFVILNWDFTLPIVWIAIVGAVLNSLSGIGNQAMIQRVMATPLKDVRNFTKMMIFCSVAISVLVNVAGIAIFCYFMKNPGQLDPTMNNDQIVPIFLAQRIPVGLAGLLIAALFAASMSTLSSSMNSVATLVVTDFYSKLYPECSDKSKVRVLQIVSCLVGVIGVVIALYLATLQTRSVFEVWSVIAALIGGGFGGMYILGFLTTRTNWVGAWVGALTSIVVTVYLQSLNMVHWANLSVIAILACLAGGYFVSWLVPVKNKDLTGLTAFTLKK